VAATVDEAQLVTKLVEPLGTPALVVEHVQR
jgi:hypothetical protein